MSRKRILPRGGHTFWPCMVIASILVAALFMSSGMWYFGLPTIALALYCTSKSMDFDDLYRD